MTSLVLRQIPLKTLSKFVLHQLLNSKRWDDLIEKGLTPKEIVVS